MIDLSYFKEFLSSGMNYNQYSKYQGFAKNHARDKVTSAVKQLLNKLPNISDFVNVDDYQAPYSHRPKVFIDQVMWDKENWLKAIEAFQELHPM